MKKFLLIPIVLIGLWAGSAFGSNTHAVSHKTVCNDKDATALPFTFVGNHGYVTFTVPEESCDQITLVIYKAPSNVYSADTADKQVLYDWETADYGPGTYTIAVAVPNCYYQIDLVFGEKIDKLGPADSDNFYGAQDRLIESMLRGDSPCHSTSTTTTVTNTITQPSNTVTNSQVIDHTNTVTVTTPGSTTTNTVTTPGTTNTITVIHNHTKIVRVRVKVKPTPKQKCLAGKANGARWNSKLNRCEFFGNG